MPLASTLLLASLAACAGRTKLRDEKRTTTTTHATTTTTPPTRFVFSHHKTGHVLAHRLVARINEGGESASHAGTWFGQGVDDNVTSFPKLGAYFAHRCLNCFEGALRPGSRVVNVALLFRDLGSGGDLEPFTRPEALAPYGLPPARSRDESYVDYLGRLDTNRGLLAEMVRVDAWDLHEAVESVRTTRRYAGFHSVCLERFMGAKKGFDDAVADVLRWLDVDATASDPKALPLVPAFDGSQDWVPISEAVGRGPGATWFQRYWEPCVGCAGLARLGAKGDGGKWICDPDSLFDERGAHPCAILSVGSNDDFTFERALIKAHGCLVHVYDHTSKPPDYAGEKHCKWCLDRSKIKFFKHGLAPRPDASGTFVTLGHMVKTLARAGLGAVSLAKIDCEGCEFDVFREPATQAALRHVLHLNLEVHFLLGGGPSRARARAWPRSGRTSRRSWCPSPRSRTSSSRRTASSTRSSTPGRYSK
ncbi:methyltransferase domain-containing protein [Aureococcus anophagefferens]|nr:methyltransferase domain-containing protein [Aureococcus anophagefferens]